METTFPMFCEPHEFRLHTKNLRNLELWNVCFFSYFPRIMGIHFSHILRTVWISASPEIFKKPACFWNVCGFPYFSCTMEIRFSRIIGTAWISASNQKSKKPITLKYLCFPIFFPYYGNARFSYFRNVWINASHETQSLGIRSAEIEECGICKKPKPFWNIFVFPLFSRTK